MAPSPSQKVRQEHAKTVMRALRVTHADRMRVLQLVVESKRWAPTWQYAGRAEARPGSAGTRLWPRSSNWERFLHLIAMKLIVMMMMMMMTNNCDDADDNALKMAMAVIG